MPASKFFAFSCVLALGAALLGQETEIKSGGFVLKCRTTENVRGNPDYLALYKAIVADLKANLESNQIALNKNVDVQADVLKSSSGKILNGVMVLVGSGGAEVSTFKGTFFPCRDSFQTAQEYKEKVYNDYFKALTDRIKSIK